MDLWQDGFFLAFVGFPVLAFAVGFVAGLLFTKLWAGAVAGALTNVVLTVTVANESLLAWIPVHAATGFAGGALGYLLRRAFSHRSRTVGR